MNIPPAPQPPLPPLALIANISDMISVADASGHITFASQSAAFNMLGYAPAELVGHRFMDFVTVEDQPEAERHLQVVLNHPGQSIGSELHFLHKHGGVRMLSSLAINKLDQPGINAIIMTSRDITEERERQVAYNQALEDVQHGLTNLVTAIGSTIGARDPYTGSHQLRVADLSQKIGKALGFDRSRLEILYLAASIHDIGKVCVPIEILTKPYTLINEELGLIKIHPAVGYAILKPIDLPWPIADIIHQHHERLDGSGYPQGLRSGEILLEAQIIAVAYTLEAMVNDRPYRKAPGLAKALAELQRGRGQTFNADVVDICLDLIQHRGYTFPPEAWHQASHLRQPERSRKSASPANRP